MDWVSLVLTAALPLVTPLLDPRRVPPHGELGKALKHVGWRGRKKVDASLRNGRAVDDPELASLAAALAKERMQRCDYRGPPQRREVLTLLGGGAVIGLLLAFVRLDSGAAPAFIGGYALVVVWVVGLRRLIPTQRDSTDRLLMAYRANASLAEKAGPGAFDRVRLGVP
jgi:hypothetical protein